MKPKERIIACCEHKPVDGVPAFSVLVYLAIVLAGCDGHPMADSRPVEVSAPRPSGTPVHPNSLAFTQDGLRNCGTIAMLTSWTKTHRHDAANLVWRQPDGSYLVAFRGAESVRVTADDRRAARESRLPVYAES